MQLTNLSLLLFASLTAIALALLIGVVRVWRRLFGRRWARRVETPPLIMREPRTGAPLTSIHAEPTTMEGSFARLVGDSDLPAQPFEVVLIVAAVALLIGGALFLWDENPLTGAAGAIIVFVLFLPLLLARRARRRMTLREQLPIVLDLMARAVRAGQSLDQAIDLIGEQSPPPWGPKFRVCARLLHAGLSVQETIAALGRQMRIAEVQELSTVLTVHRQTGGNLSMMLERLAANARDRLDFHRQFRAATAGARYGTLTMIVVFAVGFGFYFLYDNEYSHDFLAKPEGLTIFAIALGMLLLGVWWIIRILRVDY